LGNYLNHQYIGNVTIANLENSALPVEGNLKAPSPFARRPLEANKESQLNIPTKDRNYFLYLKVVQKLTKVPEILDHDVRDLC